MSGRTTVHAHHSSRLLQAGVSEHVGTERRMTRACPGPQRPSLTPRCLRGQLLPQRFAVEYQKQAITTRVILTLQPARTGCPGARRPRASRSAGALPSGAGACPAPPPVLRGLLVENANAQNWPSSTLRSRTTHPHGPVMLLPNPSSRDHALPSIFTLSLRHTYGIRNSPRAALCEAPITAPTSQLPMISSPTS